MLLRRVHRSSGRRCGSSSGCSARSPVTRGITRFIRQPVGIGSRRHPVRSRTSPSAACTSTIRSSASSLMFLSRPADRRHHAQDALLDVLALLFGIGVGLAFDEFALWLHLDDVYWRRQGRKSIDAVAWVLVITASARAFVDLLQVFETGDDLGELSWLLWLAGGDHGDPRRDLRAEGQARHRRAGHRLPAHRVRRRVPAGQAATRSGPGISTGRTPAAGPGRSAGSEWNTPLVGSGSGTLSAELPPKADPERNRSVGPFCTARTVVDPRCDTAACCEKVTWVSFSRAMSVTRGCRLLSAVRLNRRTCGARIDLVIAAPDPVLRPPPAGPARRCFS